MLQFPQSMSADVFLDRYWQKAPLFMPNAVSDELPALSADELAWLSTLDDVESRLIFTEQNHGRAGYRLEHGPFDEKLLGALPPRNWTLLVQDVEKHLPEFRRYLHQVAFIPDWRIDDLMVSFAVPGGGVGPHRDNYDVFLCQGNGHRQWQIAADHTDLRTVESGGLALLEPFSDDSAVTAGAGDVLYLPPGVAHWGVATESCMTYSIGMRAPTEAEFAAAMANEHDDSGSGYPASDRCFYLDPDLAPDESAPGLISNRALERTRSCFAIAARLEVEVLAMIFGRVVTGVKPWLAPEAPDDAELETCLAEVSGESDVRLHGMARLAFWQQGNRQLVFANGFGRTASAPQTKMFRQLCADRLLPAGQFQSALSDVESRELIRWLTAKAAFDLPQDGEPNAT